MQHLFVTLITIWIFSALTWGVEQAMAKPIGDPVSPNCQAELMSISGYRLGIGVLFETKRGFRRFAVSPYAGSVHDSIVNQILETKNVSRILWIGELRYEAKGDRIQVREANETSGFFFKKIVESNLDHLSYEGQRIPISNSVEEIPQAVRTKDFRGFAFDPENKRLARELNHIKEDVRHTIGNSLQILSSFANHMRGERFTYEQKVEILAAFKLKKGGDVTLIRWLALNLIEDARLTPEQVTAVFALLSFSEHPDSKPEQIYEIDAMEFRKEIQNLSDFVTPGKRKPIVDFYRAG